MKTLYFAFIGIIMLFNGCNGSNVNVVDNPMLFDTLYVRVDSRFNPSYALNRFETEVNDLLAKDNSSINQGKIVFYGSSSIAIWGNGTLQKDMASLEVLGHGFGGSTFPELMYYRQKLITPYHPKSIVIYCENDLFNGDGKTVQQTFDDFAILITDLHNKLPLIPIFVVSLKPSPSRRSAWSSIQQLNTLIKTVCNTHKYLKYIDVSQAMFLPNGQIDGSLFINDSLHLNSKGYALWTKVIKPFL